MADKSHGPGQPFAQQDWWEQIGNLLEDRDAFVSSIWKRGNELFDSNDWIPDTTPTSEKINDLLSRSLVAEGIEGKQRFDQRIALLVTAICDNPTWIPEKHSQGIDPPKGNVISLHSATYCYILALTDWLMGERLNAELRQYIPQTVNDWGFVPYRKAMQRGFTRGCWWREAKNNWNIVCHSLILGSAGMLIESKTERSELFAEIIQKSMKYIDGFSDDGYCTKVMAITAMDLYIIL